jgi:glycosyltransferase involved in cell wall biosynthesis
MDHLLSIVMPVFNERAHLRRCVERVVAAPLPDGLTREIIIVDDASEDGTRELIAELVERHDGLIRAFYQEKNQGKGAAIRRAVPEIRGRYVIVQDADLEYDPEDYPVLLRPLLDGKADVVYGSRFAPRAMRRVLNYHHTLMNKLLTHLSNFFTGLNLSDMETCYKVFRADLLRTIPIRSNRFGFEPEITAKVAKRNCVVYETPISYHGRTAAEGKKINWKDGVAALWTIFKYWLFDDCFEKQYGKSVLESLSQARRFSQWMVKTIEPYLGNRIIEIGSGIGNISRLLPKKESLTVSDLDADYLEILDEIFGDNEMVKVAKLDIASDEDFAELRDQSYDSVVCLNVLEHIEDDAAALRRLRTLLKPGGRLILLTPQYEWLFGSFDRHLGHHRRYQRKKLRQLLLSCGFQPEKMRNFNALAIPGWWFNACLLKRANMAP